MRIVMISAMMWLAAATIDSRIALLQHARAADEPTKEDATSQRYQSELETAGSTYAKTIEQVRSESEERYAAAKAAYDDAVRRSREAYLKSLEAEMNEQSKAGNQSAADELRKKIDAILNGPQRTDVQKLWLASYAAEQSKEYPEAIEAVQKVIQVTGNAKNTFTQTRLGWLYLLSGQYDQSESAYKTAAAISPQALTPRLGLMSCYRAAKRPDDAIATARDVLKLDPLNYQANKAIGDLLYAKEDYARAGTIISVLHWHTRTT